MPNQFFWYDVMTTDTKAAESFYRHVVGWGTESAGAGNPDYTLFTVDGQHAAGLMAIPAGTQIIRFLPALNLRRDEDGHHVIWADASELRRLRELHDLPRTWANKKRLAKLKQPKPRPAR